MLSKRITSYLFRFVVTAAAAALGVPASADSLAIVSPRPLPGPYDVQCSNLAQDFSRVRAGEDVQSYWEGEPRGDGSPRYITDLLTDPANALTVNLAVPDDGELFGSLAGRTLPQTLVICSPSPKGNPRPDYALPTGRVVPHMITGTDTPIWPDATTRWPILLFSSGFGGSPISNDYITALGVFASYGYVVVAPFHGDQRIVDVEIANFDDVLWAILHFRDYTAMQAIRPLALSAAIDRVLEHPDYRDHVDPARIGGFGASQGGESFLLMGGARLTVSVGLSSRSVTNDPRLVAAVGYVPYFGQTFFPAFGRDQAGIDGVTLPYLAIAGTADTTAPLATVVEGMARLRNTRQLVALQGVGHYFDLASTADIFTWALTFLDAHVAGDRAMHALSTRMVQVAGGGDDRLRLDYAAPAPPAGDEAVVVEYYNPSLDHYFITADPMQQDVLDNRIIPGWERTGFDFKAWQSGSPNGVPACRFFGKPGVGPSSHVYTINPDECILLLFDPRWIWEGLAFNAEPPDPIDCAANRVIVTRVYNRGGASNANHRFLTSRSEMERMVERGWQIEGPVFCTPP